MQLNEKLKGKSLWIIGTVFLLVFPVFMAQLYNYGLMIAGLALLYIIAVSGLDLLFGYSGQISMGHAAFFAIGAYGSSMLNLYFGIPAIIGMLIAAVIAAIVATLLAIPASKLVFHFLSLATIAFSEIVYQLIAQSPNAITGNFKGLFPGPFSLFGFELNSNIRFYYFALVCVVILLILKHNLVNSKVGRALVAIRENSQAANGMGVNVRHYKVLAFAVSAFYTSIAGSFYAHFIEFISPDTFARKQSVIFLTMLLFGGTASIWGPVCGAISVLLLNEFIRFAEQYQMLVYGVLMLLVIVAVPGGIYGTLREAITRVRGKKNA